MASDDSDRVPAARLSSSCDTVWAPKMTEVTIGLCSSHATATCAGLTSPAPTPHERALVGLTEHRRAEAQRRDTQARSAQATKFRGLSGGDQTRGSRGRMPAVCSRDMSSA